MHTLTIVPGEMTLAELRKVYENPVKVKLHEEAFENMKTTLEHVRNIVDNNITTYGINTGIGILASTNVGTKDLQELQQSIVLSHAVGVGPAANDGLVRLMMVLKVNSLGRGYSGIRTEIVKTLITLINKEIYPVIPIKGSVGASGDLSPLSHMASVLLGEGKATHKGEVLEAKDALKKAGIEPLTLGPREGVALINGTQTSTAFALKGLFETEDLFANAVVCGALTVEAAMASRKPFDERINKIKGHKGQVDTAEIYRYLLNDKSEISEAHNSCTRVQDPYSLRCQPQVMGACLTQIRNAAEMLLTEANSSSDNPVIFSSEEIVSAGNFHAEFVAMACDNLALAAAEIGSISERRISLLMDKNLSGLPWFLVNNSGVNTGFMTAHVTAAALVSENKLLSHPAVVDSIPTSANQEDHVSMAPIAGKRLWEMAENVRNILAIEWLCAVQGLDFRKMKTTTKLEEAKKILRDQVTFLDKDRFMASDIDIVRELIEGNALVNLLPKQVMPSWGAE